MIEVVITSGGISRFEVYNRLQVPAPHFWHQECFSLYHLREDTPRTFIRTYGYAEIIRSELLPHLDIKLLAACDQHPNPLLAAKEFRQRLQDRLARD